MSEVLCYKRTFSDMCMGLVLACVQLSYVGFYCVSVVFFLSLCLYPPISWYTVLCEFK